MLELLCGQFMVERELGLHQRALLQWLADVCSEIVSEGRTYKSSARMLAGYDLIKMRVHGNGWSAFLTA